MNMLYHVMLTSSVTNFDWNVRVLTRDTDVTNLDWNVRVLTRGTDVTNLDGNVRVLTVAAAVLTRPAADVIRRRLGLVQRLKQRRTSFAPK